MNKDRLQKRQEEMRARQMAELMEELNPSQCSRLKAVAPSGLFPSDAKRIMAPTRKKKLTAEQREEIKRRYLSGEPSAEIAGDFGISSNFRLSRIAGPRKRIPVVKAETPKAVVVSQEPPPPVMPKIPPPLDPIVAALAGAKPTGERCTVKGCVFPSILDGCCRTHYIDANIDHSIFGSSSTYEAIVEAHLLSL